MSNLIAALLAIGLSLCRGEEDTLCVCPAVEFVCADNVTYSCPLCAGTRPYIIGPCTDPTATTTTTPIPTTPNLVCPANSTFVSGTCICDVGLDCFGSFDCQRSKFDSVYQDTFTSSCLSCSCGAPIPCPIGTTANTNGDCVCPTGATCSSSKCNSVSNGVVLTYYFRLNCSDCICQLPSTSSTSSTTPASASSSSSGISPNDPCRLYASSLSCQYVPGCLWSTSVCVSAPTTTTTTAVKTTIGPITTTTLPPLTLEHFSSSSTTTKAPCPFIQYRPTSSGSACVPVTVCGAHPQVTWPTPSSDAVCLSQALTASSLPVSGSLYVSVSATISKLASQFQATDQIFFAQVIKEYLPLSIVSVTILTAYANDATSATLAFIVEIPASQASSTVGVSARNSTAFTLTLTKLAASLSQTAYISASASLTGGVIKNSQGQDPTADTATSSSSSISGGAVAGIVIAIIALIALIVLTVYFVHHRKSTTGSWTRHSTRYHNKRTSIQPQTWADSDDDNGITVVAVRPRNATLHRNADTSL